VGGRAAAAAGSAAGAAESRGRAVVRAARGQGRVAADRQCAARGGLAGQREHRRRADARAGPGRPPRQEGPQGHYPAGERPAARQSAPDLVGRKFAADGINRKWYGDGTEIVTGEGKLHLDSVLDMGSRRILGHAIGEHHDAELACGALAMAVAVRGGSANVAGVVFHSDYAEVDVRPENLRMACSGRAC